MSKFNFIATEIPGVIIIEPTVFGDSRGYFMETYQAEEFAAAGIPGPFVQDNQSKSTRGCLLYTSPSPRDRSVSRMPSSA